MCFMHVQKCAGSSVRAMLEAALPPGSLSPRRIDRANFASFDDFGGLSPEARASVVVDEADFRELAAYPAVCGHLSLPTLAALAPPSRIATILREPRARLLSYYLHLRFSVALRTIWAHYGVHRPAERPLPEFLSEASLATTIDNRVCRMLLHGDPRIRDGDFVAEGDVERLAEEAWARLEQLGFVGILERPDEAWRGLGEHFGVELRPVRRNVSGAAEVQPGMLPVPLLGGADTLELLERRTAADAIVFQRLAARLEGGERAAHRLAEAAFAEQLVRYGSFTSSPATS
jgi:hypothetical protein